MDNLRALAMTAGIFFHAAIAYSPMMHNVWPTASPDNAIIVDVLAWFSHLFRMPLFFLIAGFFAAYLVEKRGIRGLLANRALRILLPLVLFLPLVWGSLMAIVGWAIENSESHPPILQFFIAMTGVPDAPKSQPSTTHLWFLYYLCLFYMVYSVLHRLGVLRSRYLQLLVEPKSLVLLVPLLLIPALATQTLPHPAPEQFAPKLWAFGYFGVFFLLGNCLYHSRDVIDRLRAYVPWLALSSIVMYAFVFHAMPRAFTVQELLAIQVSGPPPSLTHMVLSALEAYISVHMTLLCLIAGQSFLNHANRGLRFIADSSYWLYIIHLPVLFVLQVLLLDRNWGLATEFLLSSFGTLAIGMLSYLALVRWSPIGWMLNGRR